jgi:hypothetical protein
MFRLQKTKPQIAAVRGYVTQAGGSTTLPDGSILGTARWLAKMWPAAARARFGPAVSGRSMRGTIQPSPPRLPIKHAPVEVAPEAAVVGWNAIAPVTIDG